MIITRRDWLLRATAFGLSHAAWAKERDVVGKYDHIVNVSTHQQVGVPFRLSTALLRIGLKDRYRGRINFHSTDPKAVLPDSYDFSSKDDLYESHLFECVLRTPGEHTISIRDEKTGRDFSSNVILVSKEVPRTKLYFGDIHLHSNWSPDARAKPDCSYIYARDAMNLDFCCLTEHDPPDEVWEDIKAKAKELYQPGRFATLSAYEWTAHLLKEGHKNVYYRDWEGRVLRSNYRGSANTISAADLWSQLRETGKTAMTLPHHPASRAFPVPWEHHDGEFQRAVEIYSTWGNSEYPGCPRLIRPMGGPAPGHFVQDALAAGHRLGFVGGSDSHSGRPGYPAHGRVYYDNDYMDWGNEAYTGGITAVYAEDLTREAIFDAIYQRRCYATTGQRIILDFKADGRVMGAEYQSKDDPHFFVKVIGTAPLQSVTLVRNNQDYYQAEGNGHKMELTFQCGKEEPPRETDCYYVRVIQQDGEMAWSSPIWITII